MARAHHWTKSRITVAISLRVLLVGLLFGLFSFAVGLAAGLLVVAIQSAMGHAAAYATVYRSFGLPAAFFGMLVGLISMLVMEFRQSRRPPTSRTLR